MKKALFLLLLATFVINVFADSLWSDQSGNRFSDRRARKVGDILNIIVSENATANAAATTKSGKTESMSAAKGVGPVLANLFAELGLNATTKLDASGTTTRSDSLSARIAVTVKEVLPNGNMLIEGQRLVNINKENRMMTLTGVVRMDDVNPDNSIESSLIANAQIKYDGKGSIGNKMKRGIISRIFDLFF